MNFIFIYIAFVDKAQSDLTNDYMVSTALMNIMQGFSNSYHFGMFFHLSEETLMNNLTHIFHSIGTTALYSIKENETCVTKHEYIQKVQSFQNLTNYGETLLIHFGPGHILEQCLEILINENLTKRSFTYIFYWGPHDITVQFSSHVHESAHVCVIQCRPTNLYEIRCNQANSVLENLQLVNWWTPTRGLLTVPLAPSSLSVYKNFHGRQLKVPVIHKPPWNFVNYTNGFKVDGGRDTQLLELIATKLNFTFSYLDPPDRSQGSGLVNGTVTGALGMIWEKGKREADLFMGDLSITYERSMVADFSSFTLSDFESFITHVPEKLPEIVALARPLQAEVWGAIVATLVLSIVAFSTLGKYSKVIYKENSEPIGFSWLLASIFLRQSCGLNKKLRGSLKFAALVFLPNIYIISSIYSANLTSMLATPATEKPINSLNELYKNVEDNDYVVLAEKNSASHFSLENGTGILTKLWNKMKTQEIHLVDSNEAGISIVKSSKRAAMIGGMETFLYETQRFGAHNFHLSEKLFTRYSAIAFQIGSPYLNAFNKIIMTIFESGIAIKIAENEYLRLRELNSFTTKRNKDTQITRTSKRIHNLQLETLQGAFYFLIAGLLIAGVTLAVEIMVFLWEKRQIVSFNKT